MGKYEEAASSYRIAGDILLEQGKYQEALATYELSLQLRPNDALSYSRKGDVLLKIISDQRSISLYEEAASAYRIAGNILFEEGQYNEALATYDKALTITPTDILLHSQKAATLLRLKRHNEAADVYTFTGDLLCEKGRYNEALAIYDNALKLLPQNPYTYAQKGNALLKLGFTKEGFFAYEEAIHCNPRSIYIFIMKANILLELRKYNEVIATCEDAFNIDELNCDLHLSRGIAYYNIHAYSNAFNDFKFILERETDNDIARKWQNKVIDTLKQKNILDLQCVACNQLVVLGTKSCPKCGQTDFSSY